MIRLDDSLKLYRYLHYGHQRREKWHFASMTLFTQQVDDIDSL